MSSLSPRDETPSLLDDWDDEYLSFPYVTTIPLSPKLVIINYQGHSLEYWKTVTVIDSQTKQLLDTRVWIRYRPLYDDDSVVKYVFLFKPPKQPTIIYQQIDIDGLETRTWHFLDELKDDKCQFDTVVEFDSGH
jgi:hypothetical protein